ncbi:MAG: hypothetical protein LBP31_02755 [Holosporales bacterium]|jgi:hypothetical protein|nr:hypothetical protein [Holosporales bacterium]
MKVVGKLFLVASMLVNMDTAVMATDSDGFKLAYSSAERKSLFLANCGCNSEFDAWLTRGIENIQVGDQVGYYKDGVEKSFFKLIERVMPSGLAPVDNSSSSSSLRFAHSSFSEPKKALQKCLKERTRRMLSGAEIICTLEQKKYLDVFSIRNVMAFIGVVDRQLEPFRGVSQAFEAAGDFIIDEKGKLIGGDSNELYFKLTPSGFSSVDVSQVSSVRRNRRFHDLNLDGILSGSYFLGDDVDTDFEKWISGIDCIPQADDFLYNIDDVSGAFQELIDFVIPHKLSTNLLNDTRKRITSTLYGQDTVVTKKDSKSYTSIEIVQLVMSFLKDVDKQLKIAIDRGMDREFTSFLHVDDKNKLYSPVNFTFSSDIGFQAVDQVNPDAIRNEIIGVIKDKVGALEIKLNSISPNKPYSVGNRVAAAGAAGYAEGVSIVKNAIIGGLSGLKALPPPSDGK